MKFHALAYEFTGDNDDYDDDRDYESDRHVEFRLFSSHKDITAARHALRHQNVKNYKTLPMVDIPATKAGLIYTNYITALAARHTDVDWFAEDFRSQSILFLGEGCVDES